MQRVGDYCDNLFRRQELLITSNVRSLREALGLLDQIDDKTYAEAPSGFAAHRTGAHLRHIVEFYECFLDGVESGHIDYDARKRDQAVEGSRRVAKKKISDIIRRLETSAALRNDAILWVRMEDSPQELIDDPFLMSSPGRELQILSSHTTHHFALIAMTLTAHGITVHPNFGMAPATLRHLSSASRQESTVGVVQCAP
jgi:hypothetical protein